MTSKLTRMWINQPSGRQPLHAMHGTNVLAEPENGDTMRIFFLSGDVVSQRASRLWLSEGWRPTPADKLDTPLHKEVVEVVTGLHKMLAKQLALHAPDSNDAEWLGHSNELVRKLTGKDVPHKRFAYEATPAE